MNSSHLTETPAAEAVRIETGLSEAELKRIERLNEQIDELSSDARDCDGDLLDVSKVKTLLDLAWWFTEDAIREATVGRCSVGCDGSWMRASDSRRKGHPVSSRPRFCACCQHYLELKPKAEHIKRVI